MNAMLLYTCIARVYVYYYATGNLCSAKYLGTINYRLNDTQLIL